MLTKLQFKPGVNREITSYSNEGGWVDCNRVRFRFGFPEKIGGWDKLSQNTYQGSGRALHAWNSLDGSAYIGVGTHLKYYALEGGAYNDITPIRLTTDAGGVTVDNGSTVTGSSILTILHTSCGAVNGDFVTFSGAVSLGGDITADVLNVEHQIITVAPDGNSYTIDVGVAATASDTGTGGASIVGEYQINTGLDTTVGGNGWGAGTWSRGAWGSSTPLTAVNAKLRYWTHDNFGEDLLLAPNDSSIYYWDTSAKATTNPFGRAIDLTELGRVDESVAASQTPGGAGSLTLTSGTVTLSPSQYVVINSVSDETSVTFTITGTDVNGNAQTETLAGPNAGYVVGIYKFSTITDISVDAATTGAVSVGNQQSDGYTPTVCRKVIVHNQNRITIAFGADAGDNQGVQDPLLIRFSDVEDPGVWYPTVDNFAGDLRISSGSQIVTAIETRQQILVWTDVSLHTMQFLGQPFVFGQTQVSNNTTIISPLSAVAVGDQVFWMGNESFYTFQGSVQVIPCSVKSYVFDNLNYLQRDKICAGVNSSFNEIWWFYPSAESEENDSYVIFNYVQNIWYYGSINRTAWIDLGVPQYPVAAQSTDNTGNYLYSHESGLNDAGSALGAFIESSQIDLGEGDQFSFISRLIPDVKFSGSSAESPAVDFTLKVRNFPGGDYTKSTDSTVTRTATVPVEQFTEQTFVRLRGRSFAMRLSSNQLGCQWRLGSPRIDVRPDGRR